MEQLIAFIPFVLLGLCAFLYIQEREEGKRLWLKNQRLEQAYRECVEGSTQLNHTLLQELNEEKAVADALATIVENYIKIIDETAVLLKDDNPPSIATEKEAIRLYHERKARRQGRFETQPADHRSEQPAAQPAAGV